MCCEVAVMMPKQRIIEPEPLEPNTNFICIKADYSDATQKTAYYLRSPEKLASIAYSGRMWFERNASDSARARYLFQNALKIIERITD